MKRRGQRRQHNSTNQPDQTRNPSRVAQATQPENDSSLSIAVGSKINGSHRNTGQTAAPDQIEVTLPEQVRKVNEAGLRKEEYKSVGEEKKSLRARLKSYAWRLTATYIWLYLIIVHIGLQSSSADIKDHLLQQLVAFLSSIGFAPVNASLLPMVFKIGWMILITAFNPIELLLGFWAYVIVFPIWFPIWITWKGADKLWQLLSPRQELKSNTAGEQAKVKSDSKKSSGRGLARPKGRSRIQIYTLSLLLLLGWFLLFGGATLRRPLILGAILAGWVFWLSMMRLFRLAKISTEDPTTLHNLLRKAGRGLCRYADKTVKNPFSTQLEVKQSIMTYKAVRWGIKRVANGIGGLLNEGRILGLVLADYGFSLVFVGASAILFWALAIKSSSPTLPLSDSLYFAISYFLPNIQFIVSSNSLPLWAKLGPAATAWVLFVLYIGPVGEVVPDRQKHTRERFDQTYRIYRDHIRKLNRSLRRLRPIEIKK